MSGGGAVYHVLTRALFSVRKSDLPSHRPLKPSSLISPPSTHPSRAPSSQSPSTRHTALPETPNIKPRAPRPIRRPLSLHPQLRNRIRKKHTAQIAGSGARKPRLDRAYGDAFAEVVGVGEAELGAGGGGADLGLLLVV